MYVEPKSSEVKEGVWRWVVQGKHGPELTQLFYRGEEEVRNKLGQEALLRADWTYIEIDED